MKYSDISYVSWTNNIFSLVISLAFRKKNLMTVEEFQALRRGNNEVKI